MRVKKAQIAFVTADDTPPLSPPFLPSPRPLVCALLDLFKLFLCIACAWSTASSPLSPAGKDVRRGVIYPNEEAFGKTGMQPIDTVTEAMKRAIGA